MPHPDHEQAYARFCAEARAGRLAGMHFNDGASLFAWRNDEGIVLALRPGACTAPESLMKSALKRRWRDPFAFAAVRLAADGQGNPYVIYPRSEAEFDPCSLPAAIDLMRRLLA